MSTSFVFRFTVTQDFEVVINADSIDEATDIAENVEKANTYEQVSRTLRRHKGGYVVDGHREVGHRFIASTEEYK